MTGSEAEQRVRFPALRVDWLTQTFVNWPFRPDHVQALLPPELTVDEYEGVAWVGFTPFVMANMHPLGLPLAIPGFPAFAESNLRTYVRRPNGQRGLWFLSIDVACPLMTAARVIGAPYSPARLSVSARSGTVSYTGRRWSGTPSYRLVVRPGEPMVPTERDVWLTTRWLAFTRSLGTLWKTPVDHGPWSLARATVDVLEETLTTAVGLPRPLAGPVVHFSGEVRHVRLGISRPCTAPAPRSSRS